LNWAWSRLQRSQSSENLAALADLSGQWIDRAHRRRPPKLIVLDMDSSESPIYGEQAGSAYNGHFGCTCYHPLFVFNQFGDLERCALRSGNVHSADEWERTLRPVVARYRGKIARLYFRADAAFAMPEVYEFLEAEGMKYTIRLPANRVLQDKIEHLLTPHDLGADLDEFRHGNCSPISCGSLRDCAGRRRQREGVGDDARSYGQGRCVSMMGNPCSEGLTIPKIVASWLSG
jgi:hypothetical protein